MYPFIKHGFDLLFALIFLFILLPVILLVALLLSFQNGGSPWFMQTRPGKNGNLFTIYKFKTMRDIPQNNGQLQSDHDRMTPIGKIVRKLSLDELPQLINILKGEMSFVGPRPLLPEYLPLYSKEQSRRHNVRPGITGWAQINGRNSISWQEKFKFDVYYVDHQSFFLDLKILFLTLRKVFLSQDINAGEQLTMEAFNGKN